MISASGRPYQIHVLRLQPGEDVRQQLETWCADRSVEAASIVSAVGSLTRATLRYGGQSNGHITTGDLEICSLSGTLSRHGMHIHLSIGDTAGAMLGGHMMPGCVVRTTLELVIHEIGGLRLLRTPDPATGYDELVPTPITP